MATNTRPAQVITNTPSGWRLTPRPSHAAPSETEKDTLRKAGVQLVQDQQGMWWYDNLG